MKPPCAGHCNDPSSPGARYATQNGWLCERCWSILEPSNSSKKMAVKKVMVKRPVRLSPAKKLIQKLKMSGRKPKAR